MKTERNASQPRVRVVLFTGGRGSDVLSRELINNPGVELTLAINGYDDGLSTGEVRRFLGDCLGPSDFRKNAGRLARELRSCSQELIQLMDLRFPDDWTALQALEALHAIHGHSVSSSAPFYAELAALLETLEPRVRTQLSERIALVEAELKRTAFPFEFADCSVGNLVFAGCFLYVGRAMNESIADYCDLLRLPTDLILNVTDGTNAYLVALDADNRLLATEAEIVDTERPSQIRDIFLLDRTPTEEERARLHTASFAEVMEYLAQRAQEVRPNPLLLERIAAADLIIYAPGTQHSSLYPSYLTPGVGTAVGQNLRAIKLLITNIREDGETRDLSAVGMIDKAVYYLRRKNQQLLPTPCLITHYLLNDPHTAELGQPYIPLGELDTIEDPRLVRIGNYEDGITGRHNAMKVITPFVESYLNRPRPQRIAVLLLDTSSLNKITQTILEMLRAGLPELPVDATVIFESAEPVADEFIRALPFRVHNAFLPGGSKEGAMLRFVRSQEFDYVVLFESSGMYKGEDAVNLISHLTLGKLDAAWGSRRLSVRDIKQSYQMRYRHKAILGAISYVGSHLLSLTYLLLYGRYISDTLSAARAVRAAVLERTELDPGDPSFNQKVLSLLLRDHSELLEVPVQFFPLAPEKVRRTSVGQGWQSLRTILWWRFKSLAKPQAPTPQPGTTSRIAASSGTPPLVAAGSDK